MTLTIKAERDSLGFFVKPFSGFVIEHVGDFREDALQRLVVEAIKNLDDAECEPCYKCGHTFADHEFPEDGKPFCIHCTRHAFQSFPKGWGDE